MQTLAVRQDDRGRIACIAVATWRNSDEYIRHVTCRGDSYLKIIANVLTLWLGSDVGVCSGLAAKLKREDVRVRTHYMSAKHGQKNSKANGLTENVRCCCEVVDVNTTVVSCRMRISRAPVDRISSDSNDLEFGIGENVSEHAASLPLQCPGLIFGRAS